MAKETNVRPGSKKKPRSNDSRAEKDATGLSSPGAGNFPIVGVGGSAGGLEAMTTLLKAFR